MQSVFTTGSLSSAHAGISISDVVEKGKHFDGQIIFTRDTHGQDYMNTQEGRKLPVMHCVKNTTGWQICDELKPCVNQVVDKVTFSSLELPHILSTSGDEIEKIALCGRCTDICVISNAMILKAAFPEVKITVDANCCAGVNMESHCTGCHESSSD